MQEVYSNQTIQTILDRRSVRQFQDIPLEDGQIRTILDAANRAPSAHNQQAWRFIVIQGQKRKDLSSLVAKYAPGFNKPVSTILRMSARTISSAPAVIAVMNTGQFIANGSKLFRVNQENALDFFRTMEIQSSAAAVENLLLAANSLGLGSVWLGILYVIKDQIMNFIEEPSGEFMAVVPMGYPARVPEGPKKKPLDEVVKYL
ncbi:MAG: nitroreductase family protein [Thermodesulfobacteriota bacterium]